MLFFHFFRFGATPLNLDANVNSVQQWSRKIQPHRSFFKIGSRTKTGVSQSSSESTTKQNAGTTALGSQSRPKIGTKKRKRSKVESETTRQFTKPSTRRRTRSRKSTPSTTSLILSSSQGNTLMLPRGSIQHQNQKGNCG